MSGDGDGRAAITRWREINRDRTPDGPTILVAASFTAQPIGPRLGVDFFAATDRVPAIRFADYNQLFQVCLDPSAHGAADAGEIVLVWRIEDVFERDFHAWAEGADDAEARLLAGVSQLAEAVNALAGSVAGSVVVSDATVPIGFGLDHRDTELVTRLRALQAAVNQSFDTVIDGSVERLRLAAMQHAAGTLSTFDRRSWLMYRQPFTDAFAMQVGAEIADLLVRRTRVAPKVVVLDCDDTLWSGVIADDGIGAVQAGDAFPGFAHRSFQYALRRLRHDGVLLALASKNDADDVVRAFSEVDGMVLSDDDIVARRVSWDPKPDGVASIAAELNLGLDAFVFVDDSEYEVGAMQLQLPMVRTLRVPDQIEELPDLLAETGWFRAVRVTADDRERTERLIAETDRATAATSMSHGEFLAALDLRVRVAAARTADVGRVTQLINKTNQFNVTTRRRSEAEVTQLLAGDETAVFTVSASDRFGDYGMIGVVIGVADSHGWELDTVLMSCRVLGRGVETAMLAGAITGLRVRRPGGVTATYRDSGRNGLVADLFADHGFAPVGDGRFELAADRSVAVPEHITLDLS
jgi:FkbH-like protein